jgi:hypothetical protein
MTQLCLLITGFFPHVPGLHCMILKHKTKLTGEICKLTWGSMCIAVGIEGRLRIIDRALLREPQEQLHQTGVDPAGRGSWEPTAKKFRGGRWKLRCSLSSLSLTMRARLAVRRLGARLGGSSRGEEPRRGRSSEQERRLQSRVRWMGRLAAATPEVEPRRTEAIAWKVQRWRPATALV